MRTILFIISLAYLIPQVHAQEIEIISRVHEKDVAVEIVPLHEFEEELSLQLRHKPGQIPTDQQRAMAGALDLKDAQGRTIGKDRALAPDHGIVLGYSGGTAEILESAETKDGIQIAVSFKDQKGRFVVPDDDHLAISRIDGTRLCRNKQAEARARPEMHFTLLVDRSGSMRGIIRDVRLVANEFLSILPDHASCTVSSFNESLHTHGPSQGAACRPENFNLRSIKAEGWTHLSSALKQAYKDMAGKTGQKAVILITDGHDARRDDSAAPDFQTLQPLKGDVLTFAYWLGDQDGNDLAALADYHTPHQGSIRRNLRGYFDVLAGAYARQQTLIVKDCDA